MLSVSQQKPINHKNNQNRMNPETPNQVTSPTWKVIPNENILHYWKDKSTGEEMSVSPNWYQNNGTPSDDDGKEYIYVRTEIQETPPTEILAEIKEHNKSLGEFLEKTRKVKIEASPEGLRIQLCKNNVGSEDNADVYVEANPEGFQIFTHANAHEEPFSIVNVKDNGKHQTQELEENLP